VAGFATAFAGHIALASATRSAGPGPVMSIFLGLPGAALALIHIHSNDRA